MYSEEDVDAVIEQSEYKRIGPYVKVDIPFSVVCKRGHETTLSFSYYLIGHSGCKKCADIEHTGELSPNWKGGTSEVIDDLRKSLKEWKKAVLIRDKFQCALTCEHEDLVVHHLTSFNTMLKQASASTNIPILHSLKDYNSIKEYQILEKTVVDMH